MEINNNYINIQQLSGNNISKSSSTSSNSYQLEMEKAAASQLAAQTNEVSKTEYSEEEIAEFLKDKPYTAFNYNFYKEYAPEKAKKSIINDMQHYYDEIPNPTREKIISYNIHAKNNNMTPEDIKADLDKYTFLKMAEDINNGLKALDSVVKYREDYGIDVTLNVEKSYFDDYFGFNISIMYQDIKADENGNIMILPKNSDKWLTRDEFIEICPDYEVFAARALNRAYGSIRETSLVLDQGEEAYKKYVENFIAGLSDEEIQLLKDNDIFASPEFQVTGIKGLEQFTKDIEDINSASVRTWSGLNDMRQMLLDVAETQKLNFVKSLARSDLKEGDIPGIEPKMYIFNFYANVSAKYAKLIRELGLSDYIKIDISNMELERGTINGYDFDMDFINEYSECFLNPKYDYNYTKSLPQTNEEYEKILAKYGTTENIEKAYLYALDNNLSLDILSNDYTSAIGVEVIPVRELHDNLNGRDDFMEAVFSKENIESTNKETNSTVNIELDLKSRYLSKLSKNNSIDILLDMV